MAPIRIETDGSSRLYGRDHDWRPVCDLARAGDDPGGAGAGDDPAAKAFPGVVGALGTAPRRRGARSFQEQSSRHRSALVESG